jgi:threonine aldolase
VRVLHPVQANAVFVDLPSHLHAELSRVWAYHPFEGSGYRFMCSWRTTETEVDTLVADLRRLAERA